MEETKALTVVREPESVQVEESVEGYKSAVATTWTQMLPYSHTNWINTVKHYGVTIPEQYSKLIDRTMGMSTCTHCGYKTAGYQGRCTNHVFKMTTDRGWNYRSEPIPKGKVYFKGDVIRDERGYSVSTVTSTEFGECASKMDWDLAEQFNEQKRFYDFLNGLYTDTSGDFQKFGHLFSDAKDAQIAQLTMQVETHRIGMTSMFNALHMIKDKMNAAGQSLYFNGM